LSISSFRPSIPPIPLLSQNNGKYVEIDVRKVCVACGFPFNMSCALVVGDEILEEHIKIN